MWRMVFLMVIYMSLGFVWQMTKHRGWRYGIGTILFVMTVVAIFFAVIYIDIHRPE